MKNKKTLYHFVLDKSGSMHDCKETTVTGFNNQLATIKELQTEFQDQEFEVSLTIFNNQVDHVLSHVEIAGKCKQGIHIPPNCCYYRCTRGN